MNRSTLLLAAELVETHAEAGESMRQLLASSALSTSFSGESNLSRLQLESAQAKAVQEETRQNNEVIDDLVSLLPGEVTGGRLLVDTEQTAKYMLAHTLGCSGVSGGIRPYYIVGRQPLADQHVRPTGFTRLLLWPVAVEGKIPRRYYSPQGVTVSSEDLRAFDERAHETIATTLTDEELRSHFDSKTGMLKVGMDNYTALSLSSLRDWRKKPYKLGERDVLQPRAGRNGDIRLSKATKNTEPVSDASIEITDTQLDAFGFFDHINDLTSDFGVSQSAAQVLRDHTLEDKEGPY